MASTPSRVAASRSAPAGSSGFPVPSDSSLSLAPDELLQRQLAELAAIQRRLRRLRAAWPAAGPAGFRRPANGDFLLYPTVCRYQRALAALEGACGALALVTGARLDRVRPGLERLRGLGEPGGVGHERH